MSTSKRVSELNSILTAPGTSLFTVTIVDGSAPSGYISKKMKWDDVYAQILQGITAGADGQILFNNLGAIDADTGLTFDVANQVFGVAGALGITGTGINSFIRPIANSGIITLQSQTGSVFSDQMSVDANGITITNQINLPGYGTPITGVADTGSSALLATQGYVDALVTGGVILQGDWDATTNTPDITTATDTGYAWRVSVAGATNLGGITDWLVGDLAVKTDTGWMKIDNNDIDAVWGNITGTLSNQTDLQNALDAKQDSLTFGIADTNSLIVDGTAVLDDYAKFTANGIVGRSYSEVASDLSLVIGVDVQAYNATLDTVASGTYAGDDSIVTVGTITTGTWNASTIPLGKGGTGQVTAQLAINSLSAVSSATAGQILTKVGANAAWADAPDGLPSQIGQSGKFLTTNGTIASWATVGGATSPLTTKGDLWGFSTVDARVPVGTDDFVLTADSTAALGVAWKAATGGGIAAVVDDTSPQLGGMLDVNGQAIGDGALELIKFVETLSAVNEITITNAATGNAPSIAASGDDTNIDITLSGKGTGNVNLGSDLDVNGNNITDPALSSDLYIEMGQFRVGYNGTASGTVQFYNTGATYPAVSQDGSGNTTLDSDNDLTFNTGGGAVGRFRTADGRFDADLGIGTDFIDEKTVAAGVTIDGLLIKDNQIPLSGIPASGSEGQVLTINTGSAVWADAVSVPVVDETSIVYKTGDVTAAMRIDVNAVATGTVRVLTMPNQDIDLTPGTGSFATAAEGDLAATALQNLIQDTTPQLGGDLDLNTHVITGMVIGTDVQAWNSILDNLVLSSVWAGTTDVISGDGLGGVGYLTIGTDIQAWSSVLQGLADSSIWGGTDDVPVGDGTGGVSYKTIGTDIQAWNSVLDGLANSSVWGGTADVVSGDGAGGVSYLTVGTDIQAYGAILDTLTSSIISITSGVGNNDKLVTQGYVDDATAAKAYGEMYVTGGSTILDIPTAGTFVKVTQWTTAGLNSGVTADPTTNDDLTVTAAGKYIAHCEVSFSGTINSTYTIRFAVGGVAVTKSTTTRKLSSGGDVGSASLHCLLDLAASAVVTVEVTADTNGDDFILEDGNFSLVEI